MSQRLTVKVFPKSKVRKVVVEESLLKVYVSSPPEHGNANKELIDLLSQHLNLKKSAFSIAKGHLSRVKLVDVEEG